MDVLYDVTPLGLNSFKTGVWRVTENLAEELALRDDINLKLCTNSILTTIRAKKYIAGNGTIPEMQFSIPPLSAFTEKIVRRQSDLLDLSRRANLNKLVKYPLKAENVFFEAVTSKMYNIKGEKLFANIKDLQTTEIYHSPSQPVPMFIHSKKNIKPFYTHYDIIPILFPNFYGIDKGFLHAMKQLNKDTWIVCISESAKTDLLNYMRDKIDENKVFVTPLAASPIFYKSQDKAVNKEVMDQYGLTDIPYILSLCTFDDRKNIHSVIKAFAEIIAQEHIPALKLVLIGKQRTIPEVLSDQLKSVGDLRKRIIMTGEVPDAHLSPLYSEASMFVYPSLYEGFGLPPLEAMQCGTPVITSNTSSLPEVVGDAAVTISPTDTDALADGMLKIYTDPTFRLQLSEKSLQRAKLFSWGKCAEETVRAYKTSLK